LVMLLAFYLAVGLLAKSYSPRVRLLVLGATVVLPAGFYFFWT